MSEPEEEAAAPPENPQDPETTETPIEAADTAAEPEPEAAPTEVPVPVEDEVPQNDDVADVTADAPRLKSIVESLLFVADKPLTVDALKSILGLRKGDVVAAALAALREESAGRGVVVHEVAGGWQLRTHPDNAQYVQKILAARPVKLSRPQLETLAIVAYRQPITRPEIDEIRGVDSGAVLKLLMERDLIRILGKKEEPGRPMLYGTSKQFLEFFNLKDLRDLPTLREFHELSQESQAKVSELDQEMEAAGEGGAGAAERAEHDAAAAAPAETPATPDVAPETEA